MRDRLRALAAAHPTPVLLGAVIVLLLLVADRVGLGAAGLLSDALARIGQNGLYVLALLPAVRGGLGLNFGLPIGAVCGLFGAVVALERGATGLPALGLAAGTGLLLALPMGLLYGKLLNRARGQEMMVGTYAGFAVVAAMCLVWLRAPFSSPEVVLPIGGRGVRTTLTLDGRFQQALDSCLRFTLGGVTVPTGSLAVFALACLLVSLAFRTRGGLAIAAARPGPLHARAAGVDEERARIAAAVLSTAIAAVGAVVFAQSYGLVQLYTAPLLVAFPAVASLLLGGASLERATLGHVVLGTALFQTTLTVALPVFNRSIGGDFADTFRLVLQNGLILAALVRRGGRT